MRAQEVFLVVEDDADVLHLMKRALETPDRKVLTSLNGAGALAQFHDRNGRIDLVLTDVVLPDMTGPEMVRRMLPATPDLNVLFMSGYSPEFVADYTAGLKYPVLRKPFLLAQLRGAVAKSLTRAA